MGVEKEIWSVGKEGGRQWREQNREKLEKEKAEVGGRSQGEGLDGRKGKGQGKR